jgi:tripartite-type tricarboxylate transporter receptor subunit TctC
MKLSRRRFLHLAAGTAALPAVSPIVHAQTYPIRSITLVVPIAAGGAVDTAARIIAERLQQRLQQSVVVENRPGAGSLIGTNFVAKAAPDGYTLLLMEPGAVLAKWLNKTVPFDVTRDFSPIAMVATSPLVLFAHPSVPIHDVKELIAYSKANPRKLSVGTPGVGTPHHLAAAWLNTAAKIDITHVPYRGAAPALNDLLGGQIPLIWASPVAVLLPNSTPRARSSCRAFLKNNPMHSTFFGVIYPVNGMIIPVLDWRRPRKHVNAAETAALKNHIRKRGRVRLV